MNPGIGLWSTKLHEHLQPRRHILLEPENDLYLSFLQPLVDKPQSTYRLLPWSGLDLPCYDRLFAEGHLPEQESLKAEGARANTSLLFIANLAFYPEKRNKRFTAIAPLMIHKLMSAIRSQSFFQAYGMVRMLLWVADGHKRQLLPRTVADRRKYTVEAEVSCENVVEIAGADEAPGFSRREKGIDMQSAVRVLKLMQKRNMESPETRKGELQKEAEASMRDPASGEQDQFPSAVEVASLEGEARSWHVELANLEQGFRHGRFAKWIEPQKTRKVGVKRERTPEFARLQILQRIKKSQKKHSHHVGQILDKADVLDELEKSILDDRTLTEADREQKRTELASAMAVYTQELDGLKDHVRDKAALIRDDRRAFRSKPPLLLWDRRPYEPLMVHDKDFAPQSKLALLDLQPRELAQGLHATADSATVFDFIVGSLFSQPKQTVPRGVASLAPGATEALIPQVPSLFDPDRGGQRDVERMTIRLLTPEMIEGLVKAWETWPFRLSKRELLMRMGTELDQRELD